MVNLEFLQIMEMDSFRQQFEDQLSKLLSEKRQDNSISMSRERYAEVISSMADIHSKKPKSQQDYRRMARYQVLSVSGTEKLIQPIKSADDPVLYFATNDELFDILHEVHTTNTGHGGRNRMKYEISKKYCNITKDIIMLYLSLCTSCKRKQHLQTKGYVANPIISNDFCSRGQVDLIGMQSQPSQGYRYVMVYQDHLTKFVMLDPLQTKRAEEVAVHLLKNFSIIGAPAILQSDNGREFANRVVEELCTLWDGIRIVHGKPRHSQSQGSVERANQDVEHMLATWMADNHSTNWVTGLTFVQMMKNGAYHHGIKRSPYEAMFGCPRKMGLLSTSLPKEVVSRLHTEEDLDQLLNSPQDQQQKSSTFVSNPAVPLCAEEESDKALDSYPIRQQQTSSSSVPDVEARTVTTSSSTNDITCFVCQKSADGAHSCFQCGGIVHAICGDIPDEQDEGYGSKIVCSMCLQSQKRKRIRENCRDNLLKQAKRMKDCSNKKHKLASVGDSVIIPVPKVDRARTDFANIMGMILEVEDEQYYKIGTKVGILSKLFTRNQFELCNQKLLSTEELNLTIELNIRQAAAESSLVGGQGIKRCNCKTKCQTNKCNCRANNVLCNSYCHGSLSCCNK